tara:strand:+ start:436 stop:540 length:105 start_codon:yes stop_codon:yes gene_type:complete
MFVDSGIIVGLLGDKPPLIQDKKRNENKASRKEY